MALLRTSHALTHATTATLPASSYHWVSFCSVTTRESCLALSRMLPRNLPCPTPSDKHCRGIYFKDYFNQPTAAELGTMVAILEIGAFISSLLVGRIGDLLG